MKVGIAQINATVGDFPGNAKRILAAYRECLEQGADVVLTPELSLTGYPPRDLVFKSQFVPKCLQALDYLADEATRAPLIVGFVGRTGTDRPGKPFSNSAAVLHKGEVKFVHDKTLLPTYDVFDERRYFEPAEECLAVKIAGLKVGLTICEDIWTEDYLHRPLYDRSPSRELSEQGVDVILNLSASPYALKKPHRRRKMISEVASKYHTPVVYCNCVGANDQLIFDGHSLVADAKGRIVKQFAGFEEEVATVDLDALGEKEETLDTVDEEQLFRALVLGLKDYTRKCGFTKVCLGLSGGIDSALTAAIAVEAMGAENVRGMTMPSPYSSGGSVDDSIALAKSLGMQCDTVPISDIFSQVKDTMAPVFGEVEEDVTEENMQARIRAVLLMALSNKSGAMLLTTGNKSELAVGYCTIYGDMCGGLAVLSDLPKVDVYAVSRWVNRDREVIPWNTIDKPPSAELRPDQKDADTLPPYEILDAILDLYVEKQLSASDIIDKHGFDEETVRWIQRRVDLNEYKRQQAAPGLRVTSKAFGDGRRIPIVQRFVD